jgi:aspartyl-tRNA(Asn)/glutamyl-tRNA(Gln) amidotransferase subunit A
LKPTYGRVSRYGLVAFASSLDQIGPLTKDVTDAAVVMNAISGYDPRDSTSVPHPVPDYTQALIPDLHGLRIGVPREYFVPGMQPEVEQVIRSAQAVLEQLGAEVDWEVSLPHTPYALAVYYIIAPSEASTNLARYDGVKYGFSYRGAESMWDAMEKTRQFGFGPEVKRRIMLGTYALSAGYYDAYYLKAQKVRTLIREEFEQCFKRFDALVTPTSPTVPFKLGEKVDDPLLMYLSDVCTLPINIAGIPAISVPAGFANGLPVGMQIIGKPFSEEVLLRIAFAYEQATEWHKRRPQLSPEKSALRNSGSLPTKMDTLYKLPQPIQATCYSGYTYAERPDSFIWQGTRYKVQKVEREWQEPGGRHFQVRAEDNKLFELCYNEPKDEWVLLKQVEEV